MLQKENEILKRKLESKPPTPAHIKNLILEMKKRNIQWGNGKIRGELLKLGIKLDKRTIALILHDFRKQGKIRKGLTWKKFIKSHMESLFAIDFFTVDSIFNKRYYVFFIIHLKTRKIVSFDITTNPVKRFVEQRIDDMMWEQDFKKLF